MAKLTKFPVIAPDETEYRVKITEHDKELKLTTSAYVKVRLYVTRNGRKLFRYKLLDVFTYEDGAGVYNSANPDYIKIVRRAISDHEQLLEARDVWKKIGDECKRNRSNAITEFEKWDGIIRKGDG